MIIYVILRFQTQAFIHQKIAENKAMARNLKRKKLNSALSTKTLTTVWTPYPFVIFVSYSLHDCLDI